MKLGYHLFDQKSEFSYYVVSDPGLNDDYIWNPTDVNVNELLQTSFFELDLANYTSAFIRTQDRL